MHAPHSWLAAGPNTRQTRPATDRSAVVAWLTERRLLEILDILVLALLLVPFFVA